MLLKIFLYKKFINSRVLFKQKSISTTFHMSGHSKWSTIKRKKGVLDAKKSKYFSRLSREIATAVKQGGSDISMNPKLRLAVQNAKAYNMPKDNIERAINKGLSGEIDNLSSINYEGTAWKGSAFIIECLTDNPNRTIAPIRTLFNRNNGSIGKTGSVGYLFDHKSIFTIDNSNINDADDLLLELIDYGVENIETNQENDDDNANVNDFIIIGNDSAFSQIQQQLENLKINIKQAELIYMPNSFVVLDDDEYEKANNLIDQLEDLDDVQNVYCNIKNEKNNS